MKNIQAEFDSIANRYDSERKWLIPCFNLFYETMCNLAKSNAEKVHVLDIGAGTGLLTNFVFNQNPVWNYHLIDFSEKMLSVAKERFVGHTNFNFILADYAQFEYPQKYDIIMSSLSIHHFEDDDKLKLYQQIFDLLNPNGVFILGDLVSAPSQSQEIQYQTNWIQKIENTSLSSEQKSGAYQRMKLDLPSTCQNTLSYLAKAGFSKVDLVFKYYNFSVFEAKK